MGCQTLRARGLFPLVSDTRRRLFLPDEHLVRVSDTGARLAWCRGPTAQKNGQTLRLAK
jgi:branched-subunit amino acid aminotransferase/4-amino-4-deoxychorismate lyase